MILLSYDTRTKMQPVYNTSPAHVMSKTKEEAQLVLKSINKVVIKINGLDLTHKQ